MTAHLRDELADTIAPYLLGHYQMPHAVADALIAGPLAPLLAELADARQKLDDALAARDQATADLLEALDGDQP